VKFQQAESLASASPEALPMKRNIPFQQDLTVALFAFMFVVVLLVFLASIPLLSDLFPGN
jgi:hypothetical protein